MLCFMFIYINAGTD